VRHLIVPHVRVPVRTNRGRQDVVRLAGGPGLAGGELGVFPRAFVGVLIE